MGSKKTSSSSIDRRAALKVSAAVGSVAATQVFPKQWQKPVLDHVVLPGHAVTTTTETASGVFSTQMPLALNMGARRHRDFASVQFELLDQLISTANASHISSEFCGISDSDGDGSSGNSSLFLRLNDDMSVDIAVDSLANLGSTGGTGVCSTSSTHDGMTIADASVGTNDDGNSIVFSNMTINSDNTITGQYSLSDLCSGSFSAERAASDSMFPTNAVSCDAGSSGS